MSLSHSQRNVTVETALHPAIYGSLLGSLLWLTATVWLAFGWDSYTALQLAIATFLAIMFALVPYGLSRLERPEGRPAAVRPFRDWSEHEFSTASGPVSGKEAAIMVMLAPAAVALGLTAMAAISYLAAHGLL